MELLTLFVKICKICFCVVGDVYEVFRRVLSKTSATLSLQDAMKLNNFKRFPRLVDVLDSSRPLKEHPWNASYLIASIEVFRQSLFSTTSCDVNFSNILTICYGWFIRSAHALSAFLCGKVISFPICAKNSHLFPSLIFFYDRNPLTINASNPKGQSFLWNNKHGKQNAASEWGEYFNHDEYSLNHDGWKLLECFSSHFGYLESTYWYEPILI